MARNRKPKRDSRGPLQRAYDRQRANDNEPLDATRERLAKDDSTLSAVKGEGHGKRVHKTRRLQSCVLDRIEKYLTDRQYQAGDWYRELHHRCRFVSSPVGAYGERIGGRGDPTIGLPATEKAALARREFARLRKVWSEPVRRVVDAAILHDELPTLKGSARQRSIAWIGTQLDALATYRESPGTDCAQGVNKALAASGTLA